MTSTWSTRSVQILEEPLEAVGVGGVERGRADGFQLQGGLPQPFGVAADQDQPAAVRTYLAGRLSPFPRWRR